MHSHFSPCATTSCIFFHGETVIAYAFIRNVCIVSPDPIGPPNERHQAWEAFRSHAELQGWPVGVLGASDDWLPIYRQSGMSSVYIGLSKRCRADAVPKAMSSF